MDWVGLTSPPAEVDRSADPADLHGLNRAALNSVVTMVLAVARRSEPPADHAAATSGGFTVPLAGEVSHLLSTYIRHM